jgi:hypothetical protein
VWHDPQRQLVVYDTPDADKVARMIPNATRLSNGYIAVPTSTYNLQMLRYLGMPTLPPLEVNGYDYPGKYTPFAAQRITANFLVLNPRAFVLSDMGTGKTLSALWAADTVMRANPGLRCLVVAPLSTLRRVCPTPSSPTSLAAAPASSFTAPPPSANSFSSNKPISISSTPRDSKSSSASSMLQLAPIFAWSLSTRHRCTRIAPLHDTRLRESCWLRAIISG